MISVIVPNYNHSQFLRRRIDSILNQTYQDFELILLDDCSSDSSREILLSYQDNPHVSQIVFNEVNTGSPFIQWMKGIELARGDWIWIAESDDWSESVFLETAYSYIERINGLSLFFSNSSFEFDDASKNGFMISDDPIIYDGYKFIKRHMLCDQVIYNASAVVFSKENAQRASKEFLKYKAAGDKLFWIELCEQGSVAYVPDCLNHFRQHIGEVSTKMRINGSLFKEEYSIYDHIKQKPYMNVIHRDRVVNYYLREIEETYERFPELKDDLLKCWKTESVNQTYLSFFRFFRRIIQGFRR